MSRLLRVEFRRLVSRRLFRLMMLGFVAVTAFILVLEAVHSNRDVAGARASAQAQAAANANPPPPMVAFCARTGTPVTIQTAPPSGPGPDGGPGGPGKVFAAGPCTYIPPTAADFYSDPRFFFTDHAANDLATVVGAVALLGFVVGAGLVGAEWAAGTFALLLTWEPRRLRVLAAKLIAAMVSFVAVAVVAMIAVLGVIWLIAATRGSTAGVHAALEKALLWRSLRGLVLVALLTGAGMAIAGLTRHTATAMVAFVAYLIAFELVLRRVYPGLGRWLLTSNAGAFLTGSVKLDLQSGRFRTFGSPTTYTLHADRAAIYLIGIFIILVGLWAVALVRRDVDEGGR